jgi:serine/threonine-protein kinase
VSLVPGTRLGPYEITAKLGEGGMGVVFKARDFHLGREVALKVLPEGLTDDPERLARFEREAKLLAQLNHPNIAQIHGLEIQGDTRALVMELVEGPTLAERLEKGALPLDESLSIARQIAEALEEAHEKGIIHRDLKPQNVKASIEGRVKVLDFGLAKAMDPAGSSSALPADLAHSPTITFGGTREGVILGTAAYMSPEQARGTPVDKRADIWAFGVVLWEMLAGRRLFDGPTVPDVLGAILRQEVDFAALPAHTPPGVHRLLRRCLERNPKNRLHDIADARLVIDDLLAGRMQEPTHAAGALSGAQPRLSVTWLALVAAIALAAGIAAGWRLRALGSARSPTPARWSLALPEGLSLSTGDVPQIAISRDGRCQAVVVVDENGTSQLLARREDEFEGRLLPGTEGAEAPFFSPDGAWIGFVLDSALMKIPVAGGPPLRIVPVGVGARGATWSTDGYIYFAPDFVSGLSRIAQGGGTVEPVTRLDAARSERTHRWPEALPGGEAVLFTNDTHASPEYYDDARIEAVRPTTGERHVLVEGASQARHAPGGFLVFARGGSLHAVRFDPRTLEVSGAPVEVARGIATNVGSGAAQFASSESGGALWAPGGLAAAYRVVWVDREGRETPLAVPPFPYHELALSPDGAKLALVGGQGGASDLWIVELASGGVTRLTSGRFVRSPVWTPDGSRTAFAVFAPGEREDQTHLEWQPVDGSVAPEILAAGESGAAPSSFSPGGDSLIYDVTIGRPLSIRLAALSLAGDRRSTALAEERSAEQGVVSPDGRWLAYVSTASGQHNVFVRPFPAGPGRWQVSSARGFEPQWSRDGRELYYRADAVLYRVTVETARGFTASRPAAVLDRVASGRRVRSYALSPDGSRILAFRAPAGSGARRSLHLDLRFADRLADLVSGNR